MLTRIYGAILGFEMSLMPIIMDLMGWRGAEELEPLTSTALDASRPRF